MGNSENETHSLLCVLQLVEKPSRNQPVTSPHLVTPMDTPHTLTVSGEYLLLLEKRCTHTL